MVNQVMDMYESTYLKLIYVLRTHVFPWWQQISFMQLLVISVVDCTTMRLYPTNTFLLKGTHNTLLLPNLVFEVKLY